MSYFRRPRIRDANEPEIARALRTVGAVVHRIDVPCDLIVGHHGVTYLLEVKLPLGAKGGLSGRDLTPAQRVIHENWRGSPIAIVRSPADALALLGIKS